MKNWIRYFMKNWIRYFICFYFAQGHSEYPIKIRGFNTFETAILSGLGQR
jgi:hypothetical protein